MQWSVKGGLSGRPYAKESGLWRDRGHFLVGDAKSIDVEILTASELGAHAFVVFSATAAEAAAGFL
jgi:hypothetical protein